MSEVRSLRSLAREPLYNTAAVVQQTDVPADTFRAWERRYGLPRPFRTPTHQRLYTEQDIGIIHWLRSRTDEGMTISQAIQRLRLEFPEAFVTESPRTSFMSPQPATTVQFDALQQRFLGAATTFDMHGLDRVLDEALARWSIDGFCSTFVEPLMHDIAGRLGRREFEPAAERFAMRAIARRLSTLAALVSVQRGRGTILLASPPGEALDVRLLVLLVVLSRRGWHVVDLGGNISADDLTAAARVIRPTLVCLSAFTNRAVVRANAITQALDGATSELPVVVACAGDGSVHTRPGPNAHVVAGDAQSIADWIDAFGERRGG